MIDRKAYQFFAAHAGGWVGHNAETAASLARAEQYAAEHEWSCSWEADDSGACSEPDLEANDKRIGRCPWCLKLPSNWREIVDGEHRRPRYACEHYIVGCVLRDRNGKVLASLWGMTDSEILSPYARVVEAELASEALAEIKENEKAFWRAYDAVIERMVTQRDDRPQPLLRSAR